MCICLLFHNFNPKLVVISQKKKKNEPHLKSLLFSGQKNFVLPNTSLGCQKIVILAKYVLSLLEKIIFCSNIALSLPKI